MTSAGKTPRRQFSLRGLLIFCLVTGLLLGVAGPTVWRAVQTRPRQRPPAYPAFISLLPPSARSAERFLNDSHGLDGKPIGFFRAIFSAPDEVVSEGNVLAWRYECADGDVTLIIDSHEYLQGRVSIVDADVVP